MRTSAYGVAFIKAYERCVLTPYRDAGGKWTVGWGHLLLPGEPVVPWTQEKADATFLTDLAVREDAVNRMVKVPLEQIEFDALMALVYNIGVPAFETSTLLKLLNALDYIGAAMQFTRWDRVDGKRNHGLLLRRVAETCIYTIGDYSRVP